MRTHSKPAAGQEILSRYPENSVGSMMDPHYLSFRVTQTVSEAVEMIRLLTNSGVPLLYAYAVDDQFKLKGVLVMRDLLLSADTTLIGQIMRPEVYSVNAYRSKDEVAKEVLEKKYYALPVTDNEMHLLGLIKADDLMDLAKSRSSEDIQKLFGAGAEERAGSRTLTKVSKRLGWLQVNLATAFAAAAVISMFEGLIAKITILAAFLPIIAGQGGNTGAQALAVVMRGLALDEIKKGEAIKLLRREISAGAINGLLVGLTTAVICFALNQSLWLALIVGIAMLGNMVIAASCGALIPLTMKRAGLDPAQCSSIILTTFTDVFGFLILLSLAYLFQAKLL